MWRFLWTRLVMWKKSNFSIKKAEEAMTSSAFLLLYMTKYLGLLLRQFFELDHDTNSDDSHLSTSQVVGWFEAVS